MSISLTKQFRVAKTSQNEPILKANCISTPSVTYKALPVASTDPFAGKTNKYAESKIVEITSLDKGCHVKFSSGGTDATANDYTIPTNETRYFAIDESNAYLRILERASAATVYVTEVY